MFFFHEGLPGSGKSYEAVTKHLIGALAKGRPVDAYVEGLDHAKLADLAGITEGRCRELLVTLTREQVPDVWKHSRDNALVFIDEMQNFWPSNKQKLGPEITQFITEHRHRGQDICGMGQDLRDVHAMWRRRCGQKVVFSKLDGLGRDGNYSYRLYKAVTPEKFELVSKGVGKYDEKFFGSYASHTSDDINTENYKDSRAVLWNTWQFRLGLPVFAVAVVAACWFLYNALWGGEFMKQEKREPAHVIDEGPVHVYVPPVPPGRAPDAEPAPVPLDYVQEISIKWRPRLSGWIMMGSKMEGVVEWYDSSLRQQERLSVQQLMKLGYKFEYSREMLWIRKDGFELLVTSWPMEAIGRLSQQQNREVGGG
ncbi:zonular occludens toxin domain-containing protein [Thauera butanivorans]|uniref:zonular occludens toxin domain-containing protein n=1 Tax=Thauera butanivorans TaxID=86174 RepID=UPI0008390BCA|nr:zonular occludens toxin domain-containing protein [Thauera butanivorans]